jgi:hypothetical protein
MIPANFAAGIVRHFGVDEDAAPNYPKRKTTHTIKMLCVIIIIT